MLNQTSQTQNNGKIYSLWQLLEQYKVVVPLIQRGYAQGREGKEAFQIRNEFIKALCEALNTSEGYLELDYVYGKKIIGNDSGLPRLELLDGQQRLTTLYILHWYCAMRANQLAEAGTRLKNFSYEVRPSSEDFFIFLCGQECRDAFEKEYILQKCAPSRIIKNHPAYNPTWEKDSSIQGMLVMLDAIDEKLKNIDTSYLFKNLISESSPIRFSFVSFLESEYGLSDNFYITMNSRGKALTAFEHFKCRLVKELLNDNRKERDALSAKLDVEWLGLFWTSTQNKRIVNDDIAKRVDNAYMNYFDVVSLILSTWDADKEGTGRTRGAKAITTIYSQESSQEVFDRVLTYFIKDELGNAIYSGKGGNFDFFQKSLDGWKAKYAIFSQYCPFPMFGNENPFDSICHKTYGKGSDEKYNKKDVLLFFAVTLAFMGSDTVDTYKLRLRVVRNVLQYSNNEIRAETMPVLLHDIYRIVYAGAIDNALRFNMDQKNDEILKQDLRKNVPSLQQLCESLEDNDLLKGRLCLFGTDAPSLQTNIEKYGNTFLQIFSSGNFKNPDIRDALNSCLLTFGDFCLHTRLDERYQYCVKKLDQVAWYIFLTDTSKWGNNDFSERSRCIIELCKIMQNVSESAVYVYAQEHINSWLVNVEQKKKLAWEYYFIKYPEMRNSGERGIFRWYGSFNIVLLRKERLSGDHCDPYLFTICSKIPSGTKNSALQGLWHTGYESLPLRITGKKRTGTMRCTPEGWQFALEGLGDRKNGGIYNIPISQQEKGKVDKEDRILLGVKILKSVFGV